MCFRETTHALNIDDLPAQAYKMGLLFSPKHVTMGLLFCPKIFSFSHLLHYHVSQLRVHGFNFLSQIHFHFVKAPFILSEEESLNKY